MVPIGLKKTGFGKRLGGHAGPKNRRSQASFLDFWRLHGFNPPVHRKDASFRPAARSWRPEANARQRCAPSGAIVFGVTPWRLPPGHIARHHPPPGRRESAAPGAGMTTVSETTPARSGTKDNGIVRQSVGTAWWHSRSADGARLALGGRRRRRDARGAPRVARGRRLARGGPQLHREGPRAGGRPHRREVGDPRPDGGQDRP